MNGIDPTFPAPRVRTALAVMAAGLLALGPTALAAAPPAPSSAELRSAAHGIVDATGDAARAAEYLVKTALVLEDGDPGKATNLRLAGRLYHHAGRLEDARLATLGAGIAAYRSGQDALAAQIFLDAAEVAGETGIPGAVESAAHRAGWVIRQGKLSDAERKAVLERVRYSGDLEVFLEGVEIRG
jgi:hypothetical protein